MQSRIKTELTFVSDNCCDEYNAEIEGFLVATIYDYDDTFAYLIDTDQQGRETKTTLHSLALARNAKGPMSSKNLSYTISKTSQDFDLKKVVRKAIYNNAVDFLNPPIKNIGYKGIKKTSTEIKKWFASSTDIKGDFQTTAMIMEQAGSGGSIFRNIYCNFLKESSIILSSAEIHAAYLAYTKIAILWQKIAQLFYEAGESKDIK